MGKPGSLEHPFMRITLRNSVSDEPSEPTFTNDKEALKLWDQILNSLRIRPGAVNYSSNDMK